jgi:hypothetical protein
LGANPIKALPVYGPSTFVADYDPSTFEPDQPRSALRGAADLALEVGSGAIKGVKFISDAAGASNPVSDALAGADAYVKGLQSAQAKGEDQRMAAIMAEAQDAGVWDQVKAAFSAAGEAPVRSALGALGTSAPVIATSLLPGVGQATWGARLATLGGLSGVQGAGVVKGSIYDAVERRMLEAGATPEQATAEASRQQEYGGSNAANIALGAGLGVAAGSMGVESAIVRALGAAAGRETAEGLVRSTLTGLVKEAPLEATQGGQEQFAQNIAEQNAGFDTPTWRGVAGQASLEGLLSAPGGLAGGALDTMGGARPAAPPSPTEASPTTAPTEPPAPQAPPTPEAVYADLVAQRTAVTEQMSAAEADIVQAQQEHDALVAARAALDAEAKLPVGERRTKSELTIAKKAATAQVKAARARIEELGGQVFATRTALDTLTPQIEAARLAVSPEQATAPTAEMGATDAAVQADQQPVVNGTAELADLITSETRDVELRRVEMQRGQQKERELDAMAAARTEELGRTPDQQIAAAQVATDETPTAMAEAFARAKPPTEAEHIDRAVKGVQAAIQPTPTVSETPAVAGAPEAVTPAPLATNIHDYIVEEIAKKKGTPEKKIKLAASIDTAIADITASAAALAPDLRPKAIAAMVKTRVGGKVSADVQNEIATHIEQVVGAQPGAKTQFSKGAVEVGDLSQRSASSLRGLEKQIGDAYVDGQMSFDEYADRSRPVIQARVYAELRENKLGPAKGIADIHPGFKQIPVGTRVLATHGARYPEPVMSTVVGSRSTKSAIDGMVTLHPRVDFGDGKARTLTAGDIKQVFAPRLVAESNAALTQDEFEAMPPAAQEAATTAGAKTQFSKGAAGGGGFDLRLPTAGNKLTETKIGDTTIVLDARPTGGVSIASVRTPQAKRGVGAARAAMTRLIQQADQEGVTLSLGASPLDKRTHGGKLIKFYESLGFVRTGRAINPAGDPEMVRAPRGQQSNAALTQDEFEALPPAAQEAATAAYNAAMRQKGEALRQRLMGIIGDRPELKVVTFAAEPGGPIGSYTRTGPLKAVISMATNAKNLLGVADHEGYHFAEDWLLTSAEKRIVANAMKPGKPLFEQLKARLQQYDRENRTNLTDEVTGTPAEARAYGFEFWRRGELQAEGHLARIWQKLQQFFERISNAVKGVGFQSVEDVFVALSRGQMAEREMVAPEGRAEYESRGADYTQTPAFKKWFGDSKIVDADGKPLVVYHGTTSGGFGEFKPNVRKGEQLGFGIHFAEGRAFADRYAADPDVARRGKTPQTFEVYLALKNPLIANKIVSEGSPEFAVAKKLAGKGMYAVKNDAGVPSVYLQNIIDATTPQRAERVIREAGYDGVIYLARIGTRGVDGYSRGNITSESRAFIAFSPTQIKSASGNTGAFDPNNPDIRFSAAATIPDRASVAMQPSGENFYGPEANLFHVERIGSISVYHVTDPQTNEAIGSVSLGSVDGKPTILTDIRVDDQRAGAGERILRSVLATANEDIYIENMLPAAVGFWKKMGVVLDTNYSNSWEHGNGFLNYTQYTEARQQRGQGETKGRSGQAGEGTTGREAGRSAAQDTSAVATRFSKAAVEMSNRKADGGLEATQLGEQYAHLIESANTPSDIWTRGLGIVKEDMIGGVGRWWTNNISTPNFISASSGAFKNVYQTFNTYIRWGKILNEQLVRERLPAWYKASDADRKAAFDVMLKRTVEKYSKNSQELADLLRTLTPEQRTLYDQATNMVAGVLQRQFESQKATRKLQLTTPGEYEKWLARRQEQVDSLLDTGYVPLRRYGDYSVSVYMESPDGTRVKAGLEFFNSPSEAKAASIAYAREIERSGAALKVELGRRSKNERDTGVSLEQFLGTLRRQGIDISQAERERLVVAMTNADSLVRTQMMHREGLAGFSTDSMRVLHEFGVNTTNEIAYARFAPVLDAALDGAEVTSDVNSVTGEPVITIGESFGQREDGVENNLWKREGPMSGFHKDRANALADAVLVPDRQSAWATKLRTAGVMYFIGGSISGAAVNAMSIPMLLVPHLSMHTDYLSATTTAMKSWKDSWQYYNILRDIDRMKNPDAETAAKLDAAGITKEMRAAIVAAADHIFDTEIHMMLGISQGTLYSKSRNLQRAAELWMAPFRAAEQTNRLASFMAAYKMASTTGVKQADGSLKRLSGQELFRFASGVVDATQNNYNASNSPGIMNNPVGALMFQFKSFPLFIIEAVALMHKQSPKSAVYMLLGLTAMAGVQGLPFAEELLDLIDVISQKLFGSPFNSRRAMRNAIKTASDAIGVADLSDAVMRGMINEITGVNIATRVSGGLLPGTRLGTADTPADRALSDIAGAPYSMVKDTMSNVGGFVSGVATGDWMKAADAIRAGGPIALRNVVKGSEQLSRGYASDTKGRKVTDVSTLDGLLQLTGLSSAKVTNMQDHNSIVIQVKAFHTQVSQDMQEQLVRAYRDGDTAKQQELIELRNKWNAQYPNMPIMPNAAAVRRAIMLSNVPLDRRSQLLLSRRMRSEFNDVFAEEE